ncbi:hypothetical protein MOJ79_05345 [Calidifontimicrobium sp. SYSU G02091]|uniref:hypothetical protein n=1 Tax=Calidifontimicrobium sp. SYSU G02091 TaxID=2926421 RepID=UPI001F5340D1|nr:hypothetical protein [Calidifontimicrobium sp. SYSU G02091]MCI1191260.1 hypothetical protein [Calidifontimicrobium sp. SYSU G02091]
MGRDGAGAGVFAVGGGHAPAPTAPWRGDEALARDGLCLRRVDGLDRLQRVAGARLRDGHAEHVAQALAQALREAGLPCRDAPTSGFALHAELRAHPITGRWGQTVTLTIAYRLSAAAAAG